MRPIQTPRLLTNRRGGSAHTAFTLIEVLVVVAIIALLIAILLPSLINARYLARRSVCFAHLHQIGIGMVSYAMDSKDYLPLPHQTGKNPDTGATELMVDRGPKPNSKAWQNYYGVGEDDMSALYPKYVKDFKVFECPGSRNVVRKKADLRNNYDTADSPRIGGAYEYNPFMFQLERLNPPDPKAPSIRFQWVPDLAGGTVGLLRWSKLKQMSMITLAHDTDDTGENVVIDFGDPHYEMKGGNMICADGHARWVRQPEWSDATDSGRPVVK